MTENPNPNTRLGRRVKVEHTATKIIGAQMQALDEMLNFVECEPAYGKAAFSEQIVNLVATLRGTVTYMLPFQSGWQVSAFHDQFDALVNRVNLLQIKWPEPEPDSETVERVVETGDPIEHVFLTAVVVAAKDRETAEKYLHKMLPDAEPWTEEGVAQGVGGIDSWWVAEDDRRDRSDCDSAVFCIPGKQKEAVKALQKEGLAY